MSNGSTVILLPFMAAFLVFVGRFYFREGASSKLNPSFLLALATMAIAVTYLVLGILHHLPEYGSIGFGVAGVGLLAFAILRIFQI
jgi:4-amino-4-deoxy-L-arabinose transferase-like glycosyltransferase